MDEAKQNDQNIKTWLRAVFSDGGAPSSSRILTFVLAIVVTTIIATIVHHVCRITDNGALGLWLTNLPLIIAALVGLMGAPYAINRATGSITDIIAAMRKS